jgi:hypothetical protein
MHYIVRYLVICGLSTFIAGVIHRVFPAYRIALFHEDGLVENLTAGCFLLASVLSLYLLIKLKEYRILLLLILGSSLICFLDEISFGERIFGLAMPLVNNVKIDAVHDLFFLGYEQKIHTHPFAYVSLLAVLFLIISQIKRIRRQIKMLCTPPYLFLGFFIASVFTASIIDLEILPYGILYTIEEMFELSASVALIFCSLSLFPLIGQVQQSYRRLH